MVAAGGGCGGSSEEPQAAAVQVAQARHAAQDHEANAMASPGCRCHLRTGVRHCIGHGPPCCCSIAAHLLHAKHFAFCQSRLSLSASQGLYPPLCQAHKKGCLVQAHHILLPCSISEPGAPASTSMPHTPLQDRPATCAHADSVCRAQDGQLSAQSGSGTTENTSRLATAQQLRILRQHQPFAPARPASHSPGRGSRSASPCMAGRRTASPGARPGTSWLRGSTQTPSFPPHQPERAMTAPQRGTQAEHQAAMAAPAAAQRAPSCSAGQRGAGPHTSMSEIALHDRYKCAAASMTAPLLP